MTSAFPATIATALLLAGVPSAPAPPGDWRAPLAGPVVVVRPFEPPPTPYAAGHRGADLAGAAGQQVLAAGPGVVTFAGRVAGRGVVVVAHAGGLRTTYEPVSAGVGVGAAVAIGAELGALEPSAHCPSPCLHWGLRDAAGYRDPMTLLNPPSADRVRLLPLDSPPGVQAGVSASRPTASCAGRASPSSGSGRSGSRTRRRVPRPRRA